MEEDVGPVVRVAWDEVDCIARECDVSPVVGDPGRIRGPQALGPVRTDTHSLSSSAQPVTNKNVRAMVRVAWDEVGCIAIEGHVKAIGGYLGSVATSIGLGSVRVDAHPLGR